MADHRVYIGEDHWVIRHSEACFDEYKKVPGGMEHCVFHKWMEQCAYPPTSPGDYAFIIEDDEPYLIMYHPLTFNGKPE